MSWGSGKITCFFLILIGCAQSCVSRKYVKDYKLPGYGNQGEIIDPLLVTTGLEKNFDLDVSPNGAYVFYASEKDSNLDIYRKKTYGGIPSRITSHPADDYSPIQSPDGKNLAFLSRRNDAVGDLHIISLASLWGGEANFPDPSSFHIPLFGSEESDPVWFPDSRRLAFTSRSVVDKSEKIFVYNYARQRFETPREIFGTNPAVSSDSNLLFYIRQGRLYILELATGIEKQDLFVADIPLSFLATSKDKDQILISWFADDTNSDGLLDAQDSPTLCLYNLVTKSRKPLTPVSQPAYRPRWREDTIFFDTTQSSSVNVRALPQTGFLIERESEGGTLNFHDARPVLLLKIRQLIAKAESSKDTDAIIKGKIVELLIQIADDRVAETRSIISYLENRSELNVFSKIELSLMRQASDDKSHFFDFSVDELAAIKPDLDKKVVVPAEKPSLKEFTLALFDFLRETQLQEALLKMEDLEKMALSLDGSDIYLSYLRLKMSFLQRTGRTALAIAELQRAYLRVKKASDRRNVAALLKLAIQPMEDAPRFEEVLLSLISGLVPDSEEIGQFKLYYAGFLAKANKLGPSITLARDLCFHKGKFPHLVRSDICLFLAEKTEMLGDVASTEEAMRVAMAIEFEQKDTKRFIARRKAVLFYDRLASQGLKQADFVKAEHGFKRILEIDSESILGRIGLIELGSRKLEFEKMLAQQRLALVKDEGDAIQNLLLGLIHLRQAEKSSDLDKKMDSLDAAIGALEKAQERESSIGYLYRFLGQAYYLKWTLAEQAKRQTNFYSKVRRTFSEASKIFGESPIYLNKAVSAYETSLYFAEHNSAEEVEVFESLADLYYSKEIYAKALFYFGKRIAALNHFPLNDTDREGDFFLKAGRAAYQSDQFSEAAAYFRKSTSAFEATQSLPKKAQSLDYLGLVLGLLRKSEEAIEVYMELLVLQESVGMTANSLQTKINLGREFLTSG